MLPIAPGILGVTPFPGITFRYTTGEADTDAFYAVHTGRVAQDRVDPLATDKELPSREDVAAMLAEVERDAHHDRVLAAEIAGTVVGYARVTSWREQDGMIVLLIPGWVLPEWRARGIGSALIRWGERRAREIAASDYPGERFELAANASSTDLDATALLQHEDYWVAYTVLEMEWEPCEVVASPLPAGLELRPVLPGHVRALAASVDESYQDAFPGGRYCEPLDVPGYATWLAAPEHDPSLWRVAWAGRDIAGQVLTKIAANRAEVFEVSVRPRWRRRGLARALLTSALQALVERQPEAIRLHTVAEFPTRARDLYESVGFRIVKEYRRYRKTA